MMKTVLVIDDDQFVRDSIRDLLEVEGFRSLAAPNGSTGVELATEHLPDVIVCDVQMPEMNGYQVLTRLQQNPVTMSIPFIFLTGNNTRTDVRQGMNLGADDYLTKPCSSEELLTAISSRLTKQENFQSKSEEKLDHLRSSIALSLPHEFRTPLTGILTSVELLRIIGNQAEPAEILEIADSIEHSTQKLHRLVQNFLLYAKLEIATHDPDYLNGWQGGETYRPDKMIANAALHLAKQAGRVADLELELQQAVLGFPSSELERVVTELVDNAFKFSPTGTTVRVTGIADSDKYSLQILNQGRGMTSEQVANLGAYIQFDRKFYEQQGTGLGFAIAKRLLELYKGELTVKSVPGELTTVQVVLPVVRDEE